MAYSYKQRYNLLAAKHRRTLATNERQRQDIRFMRGQLSTMKMRITAILKLVRKE